jgi:nitroimidazol reductase NimA-like FMN-containing flavoprotein (pyridoxamine 5'-phosphate oxidase superfamily)
MPTIRETHFEELTTEACLGLLANENIGRICVLEAGFPMALPVNYRLVTNGAGETVLVIRTRAGTILDSVNSRVGFEVDAIDHEHEVGWSVFVRGNLHAVTSGSPEWLRSCDPRPWAPDRDVWVYLAPLIITGRRLTGTSVNWAFDVSAYL